MRIGTPPSDFSGRAGRCGVQVLPFLNSGLPLSISAARSRSFEEVRAVRLDEPGAPGASSASFAGSLILDLEGGVGFSASSAISAAQSDMEPERGAPDSGFCGTSPKPSTVSGAGVCGAGVVGSSAEDFGGRLLMGCNMVRLPARENPCVAALFQFLRLLASLLTEWCQETGEKIQFSFCSG
jgi:hypothetical protein